MDHQNRSRGEVCFLFRVDVFGVHYGISVFANPRFDFLEDPLGDRWLCADERRFVTFELCSQAFGHKIWMGLDRSEIYPFLIANCPTVFLDEWRDGLQRTRIF